MYCYLLESTDKRRTYIGATVDVDRRLDQHNRKLAGGAKATAGRNWKRVMYVGGFPAWPDTLSFEWAWKYYSKEKGVAGRIRGLLHLLTMDQCTSKATPFRLWSQNFSLRVSTWALQDLEKIEIWRTLKSKLRVESQNSSFHSFLLSSFLPSKMSSSVSASQLQELQLSVDALKADVLSLSTRLAAALGGEAPTATVTTDAPKKRGRKAKTVEAPTEAKVDTEPKADEKKPRKKREPKEKATCPTAAEGVVRFAGLGENNEYKVFNNMYRTSFTVDGKEFPSVQHFLVYQKYATTDADYAAKVLEQKNPALLTGMLKSKEHASRSDWDQVLPSLTEAALKAKFAAPELRALLVKTEKAKIEFESATDAVLGIGADGNGENKLGKALMALRATLA